MAFSLADHGGPLHPLVRVDALELHVVGHFALRPPSQRDDESLLAADILVACHEGRRLLGRTLDDKVLADLNGMFLECVLLLEVLDAESVGVVAAFFVAGSAHDIEFGCFRGEHHAGEEGNGFGQAGWQDY